MKCPRCDGTGSNCSVFPIRACSLCEGSGEIDDEQQGKLVVVGTPHPDGHELYRELQEKSDDFKCSKCGGTEFRLDPSNPMEQRGGTPEEYQVYARMGGGKKICITCKPWSGESVNEYSERYKKAHGLSGGVKTDVPAYYPPSRPVDIAARILRQEGYIDNVTFTITDMNVWEEMKGTVANAVEHGLRDTGKPVGVVVIYER